MEQSKCVKCKVSCDHPALVVSGGMGYKLCNTCEEVYKSFPNSIEITNFLSFNESCPVYEARKRRAKGESIWCIDN